MNILISWKNALLFFMPRTLARFAIDTAKRAIMYAPSYWRLVALPLLAVFALFALARHGHPGSQAIPREFFIAHVMVPMYIAFIIFGLCWFFLFPAMRTSNQKKTVPYYLNYIWYAIALAFFLMPWSLAAKFVFRFLQSKADFLLPGSALHAIIISSFAITWYAFYIFWILALTGERKISGSALESSFRKALTFFISTLPVVLFFGFLLPMASGLPKFVMMNMSNYSPIFFAVGAVLYLICWQFIIAAACTLYEKKELYIKKS